MSQRSYVTDEQILEALDGHLLTLEELRRVLFRAHGSSVSTPGLSGRLARMLQAGLVTREADRREGRSWKFEHRPRFYRYTRTRAA